jgi:hypothetical protein
MLDNVVQHRRLQTLTPTMYGGGMPGRNRFGAITYEPHGTSPVPTGFTQLFRNGEIWGVSGKFVVHHYDELVVPMGNVENIYGRVLANYISVAAEDLGISPPYQVEMGAVGLKDLRVSLPRSVNAWGGISEPIYENELKVRRVLNDPGAESQRAVVDEFLDKLYDLAGVTK